MSKIEECAFELSYIKKEYEISKGEIIASKRVNLGQLLGKTHPVDADFIVPIPETAIHYAQGYAHETNTPLCHAIFKKKPNTDSPLPYLEVQPPSKLWITLSAWRAKCFSF